MYRKIGYELFKHDSKIKFKKNKDKNYLSDNPNRRLPDIKRSKNLLNFRPKIDIKLGIKKYLTYLKYRTNITKN